MLERSILHGLRSCWVRYFFIQEECPIFDQLVTLMEKYDLTHVYRAWCKCWWQKCLSINAARKKNTIFLNTSGIYYLPVAYWLSVRPVFRTSYNTRSSILVLSRSRKFFQVACVSEAPSALGGRNLKAPCFWRISVDGRPNRISKTTFSSSSDVLSLVSYTHLFCL